MRTPENIHCLALNYPGVGANDAETPLYFVKSKQAYCESGARVRFPAEAPEVWTEVELGIVSARDERDILPADAEAFIAGYVVCADISCENIHGRDHHLATELGPGGQPFVVMPGDLDVVVGKADGPEYWGLAVERFLSIVEDEVGTTPEYTLTQAPRLSWMWHHQTRMSLLSLMAAQNAYRFWQNTWENFATQQRAA